MSTDDMRPLVGMALRAAHRNAARAFAAELRPLGLENRLAGILLFIGKYGASTQRDLVARIGTDKSSMVRDIDELEERGLARRTAHPTDRRAHVIKITEKGDALIGPLMTAAARAEDRLLAGFGPQERDLLLGLLDRLTGAAPGTADPGSPGRGACGLEEAAEGAGADESAGDAAGTGGGPAEQGAEPRKVRRPPARGRAASDPRNAPPA
jgi:DNA-binding MarR family transcriptional regulator